MILQRNPIYSALFLVANFFCLAVFYVLLDAQFLAAVQIIVYAGAIMVLFLFVVDAAVSGPRGTGRRSAGSFRIPAVILAVVLAAVAGQATGQQRDSWPGAPIGQVVDGSCPAPTPDHTGGGLGA